MDTQIQLGRNLREIRLRNKISQEKLAELSSLDRTYIQSIERGSRNISVDVLIRLSQALEVKVTELLKNIAE